MVELLVRLASGFIVLGCGLLGWAPMPVAGQCAAAFGVLAAVAWALDARRWRNSGIAGLLAIGDSLAISFALGAAGLAHQLGFLVLIPCAYAAANFGAPMISMAPLAASAIVATGAATSSTGVPDRAILLHAVGVLVTSLLLGQRRPTIVQVPPVPSVIEESSPQVIEDGFLQLRESFRKLRDAYRELERKSRRDKIAARIARVGEHEGGRFFDELCLAVRELTGAEQLAIYTLAQLDEVMVVRGVTESFPGELVDSSISVNLKQAPGLIREQAEASVRALTAQAGIFNVLLVRRGKLMGMLCATASHPAKVEAIRKALEEAASQIADAVQHETERDHRAKRLTELGLLYDLSSISIGATTPGFLAGRIARELRHALKLDGIEIALVEDGKGAVLASEGARGFADCLTIETWESELVLFDARSDHRCDPTEALKRRVGSLALIPIRIGSETVAVLIAMTHATGGLDGEEIAVLHLAADEFARALERLQVTRSGGLMTPLEFSLATAGQAGCLVHLEVLMPAARGSESFQLAVRKFGNQIRAKLPSGACLCRRDENDFVAFLSTDEAQARTWANEITASASLIGVVSGDGASRIPLAIRARVAHLSSQSNEISSPNVASTLNS